MEYFAIEERKIDDNLPIEIIFIRNNNELIIEYATYNMDANLFVSKDELYLTNKDELKNN